MSRALAVQSPANVTAAARMRSKSVAVFLAACMLINVYVPGLSVNVELRNCGIVYQVMLNQTIFFMQFFPLSGLSLKITKDILGTSSTQSNKERPDDKQGNTAAAPIGYSVAGIYSNLNVSASDAARRLVACGVTDDRMISSLQRMKDRHHYYRYTDIHVYFLLLMIFYSLPRGGMDALISLINKRTTISQPVARGWDFLLFNYIHFGRRGGLR